MKAYKTPTPKLIQCLVDEDSTGIAIRERGLTIASTFQSKLIKTYEPRKIAKATAALIMRVSNSFNISNALREDQVTTLVFDLLDKYPTETLEDFAICFRMARRGEFGTVYNGLDSQRVFEWMHKYLELKAMERERNNKKQQGLNKSNFDDTSLVSGEGIKRHYEEMREEKKQKEKDTEKGLRRRINALEITIKEIRKHTS